MKKIGLVCATLLVGMSLSACNNLASQQSHKASPAGARGGYKLFIGGNYSEKRN